MVDQSGIRSGGAKYNAAGEFGWIALTNKVRPLHGRQGCGGLHAQDMLVFAPCSCSCNKEEAKVSFKQDVGMCRSIC